MDFFDTIDIPNEKKAGRVRSWYLYEQFKSLERNQLEAAEKLKERSYQGRILHQELSERRARRQLYDQFGLRHSESCIGQSEQDNRSLSVSTDDLFESFCDLQDDETPIREADLENEDAYSYEGSQTEKLLDDFKSLDNIKYDQSFTESVNVNSVADKPIGNYTEDLKDKIDLVKRSNVEEISLQYETVEENIRCLERYSKLSDDMISETSTESYGEECVTKFPARDRRESDVNIYSIWSKMVSFAYEVMQLYHGNCYYDLSYQVWTAVLACDVLRKGASNICDILQPYVSPIKFPTDESDISIRIHKSKKKKPSSKNIRKQVQNKTSITMKETNKTRSHRYTETDISGDDWSYLSKHSFGYNNNAKHKSIYARSSACSATKLSPCKSEHTGKYLYSIWPAVSEGCPCERVANPMLKIGQHIDRLLRDIDDCKRVQNYCLSPNNTYLLNQ